MTRCSMLLASAIVLCFGAACVESSAIPMWEFLSREEKMSHLYRVFSKQVTKYCSDSPMPDCTKNLLVSGLRNLSNMNDDNLDKMDPYQRGAKEMIWEAMMRGDRYSSTSGGYGGYGGNAYYSAGGDSLGTDYENGNNGLAEESSAPVSDYVRPAGHTGPYLVGPMVIRVLPDGRPVPGDSQRPLPRDEDVDDLKYAKLPSIEEITANQRTSSFFYTKPVGKTTKLPLFLDAEKPSLIETRRVNHQRSNPLFDDRRIVRRNNDRALGF